MGEVVGEVVVVQVVGRTGHAFAERVSEGKGICGGVVIEGTMALVMPPQVVASFAVMYEVLS